MPPGFLKRFIRPRPKHKEHNRSQPESQTGGFFNNASRFTINKPNMIDIHAHGSQIAQTIINRFNTGEAGLDYLLPYVCSGAAVDSSERDPPPSCHPGTRERIRSTLATWFDNPSRQWDMVWLTGPAGTGKSAVAQTFAELCADKDRLGAAFFFSRPNERDKPDTVIPTLAYQLAVHFPDYRRLLTDRIAYDPTILQKTPRAQFKRLIVEPFSTLQVSGHPVIRAPPLVLLDGLDECQGTPIQCEFVEMIGEVVRLKKGLPILWLICSRPEPHLKRIFLRPHFEIGCLREELLIDAEAKDDVDRFLHAGFAKLRDEFQDTTDSSWPSSAQFNRVSKISTGLFVLASTIIRYLGDPIYADPMARLIALLKFMESARRVGMENPLEALDLFYSSILAGIPDDILPVTKRILGHHLALPSIRLRKLPVQAFCNLLNIDRNTFYLAMRTLHSLVNVPPPEKAHEDHIQFYHASFEDYLIDPVRSGKFAPDVTKAKAKMTRLCPFSYKTGTGSSGRGFRGISEMISSLWGDTSSFDGSTQVSKEDIIHILQTRILHTEDSCRTLARVNGASAQQILDIFQRLLNSYKVGDAARQSILLSFLRLSVVSGLFPHALRLHDVKWSPHAIGGGTYGEVYRGEYQGRQICMKVGFRHEPDLSPMVKIFFHQAVVWCHLVHPNVLPFYGVYHLPNGLQVGLVLPWMTNGSLPSYLKVHPHALRLPLVGNVLAGLQYLHQHHIAHGNLKGANVLVRDDGSACLADFGSSLVIDSDALRRFPTEGHTTRWAPPEFFRSTGGGLSPASFSSDIYSLACLMLEIFTGRTPFHQYRDHQTIIMKSQGVAPSRPEHEEAPELMDGIWAVMGDCWSFNPNNRPTVDEIIKRLRGHVPLLLPAQLTQEWSWRPNSSTWTAAQMSEDRAFLVNFVSQASGDVLSLPDS